MSRLTRHPRPAANLAADAPPQGEAVLTWMQALADPTRVRLLRLLEQHELGVAELCEVLQLPQSTVSRHLKTLADGAWLVSRRENTAHLYRTLLDELDPPKRDLWVLARRQTEAWATARHDDLRLRQLLASREDGRGFFAGLGGDWDEIRREQYGEAFDASAAFALLPPGAVVADLGCGTGRLLLDVAPFAAGVIGVDASPAMLKAARRRMARHAHVDLRQGELDDLPIDAVSCDATLCVLALSYVEDPSAVLRETARVLRPGGRAVVVDVLAHDRDDFRRRMGQRHRGFSTEQMSALMAAAGLREPRVVPLPPEPQAKGPALFAASATAPANGVK